MVGEGKHAKQRKMLLGATKCQQDVLEAIDKLTGAYKPWERLIADEVRDKWTPMQVDNALQALIAGDVLDSGYRDQGGWCYVYWRI